MVGRREAVKDEVSLPGWVSASLLTGCFEHWIISMFRSGLWAQGDAAKVEVSDLYFLHTLPCSACLAQDLHCGTRPPCPLLTSNMPSLSLPEFCWAGDMPLLSAQTNGDRGQPHRNIPATGRNLISSFLWCFVKDYFTLWPWNQLCSTGVVQLCKPCCDFPCAPT